MKHVWIVSDNMDGFDTKVFSSRFRAVDYFKTVLTDNGIPFSKIQQSNDRSNFSALYNEDFWIHLRKADINEY